MADMIAYCGLICQTCPIYLATRQENKDEQLSMRTEIAKRCKELYKLSYAIEDITDCDGCRTDGGRLFSGCNRCAIRKCAGEKKLENCAYCADYACKELELFFSKDLAAKKRLDEIRRGLGQ